MHKTNDRQMIPVLMLGAFLGSLSQNMLTSALPVILEEFQVNALVGQWLTTIYLLILGVITALTAYLFHRVRTRLLLESSLLLFSGGCLLALFAQSFWRLILARAIQACGAGVLIPVLQMILLHLYPVEQQGRALGLSGIVVGFAPAVGPTVAGVLVDVAGWRSLFLMLLISTLAVAFWGMFTFRQVGEPQRPPLRIGSAVLYGVGFSVFMLAVTRLGDEGTSVSLTVMQLLVGALLLAWFVRIQLTDPTPLLHLSLFRHRSMQIGTVLIILAYTAMTSGTILLPLYIQTICGRSATLSGLILLPGSLLLAALSPVTGRMKDRFGIHGVTTIGLVLLMIGTGCYFVVSVDTTPILIALVYAARSAGLGFLLMPLTAYAVSGLPLDESSHGMAILNSLRQIGGSLCSTLLILIATAVSVGGELNLIGFRVAALLTAVPVLLSLLLWLRMGRHRSLTVS